MLYQLIKCNFYLCYFADLFVAMSELIISTASRCLHGNNYNYSSSKQTLQDYISQILFFYLGLIIPNPCFFHLGKEIRSKLDERVAQLYMDLDGGFNHLAWLFPSWIPFPSFRKRDKAHLEVKKIFYKVTVEGAIAPILVCLKFLNSTLHFCLFCWLFKK